MMPQTTPPPVGLCVQGLTVRYGTVAVLQGVSFSVPVPDLTWSWHRKLQNVWVWNIRHSRLPGILKIWSLSPAISTASGMDLR